MAVQRGLQVLARPDVVALQHLLDPAVEALDHAVGPGRCGRGQAVFDTRPGAEPVERVRARRGTPAQAEEAVGELLPPRHCRSDQWRSNGSIGQDDADADRAGALQVAQEASGVGGGPGLEDADEDPAGGAVDGDEQIAACVRQVPSPAHRSPGSPPAPWFAIVLEPVAQQWLTVVAWP
jgi:hypothetical protein